MTKKTISSFMKAMGKTKAIKLKYKQYKTKTPKISRIRAKRLVK